jgi:hypothetical protein
MSGIVVSESQALLGLLLLCGLGFISFYLAKKCDSRKEVKGEVK